MSAKHFTVGSIPTLSAKTILHISELDALLNVQPNPAAKKSLERGLTMTKELARTGRVVINEFSPCGEKVEPQET